MSLEQKLEKLQKQLIDNLNSENKRYDELNKKVKAIETQTKEQYKRGDKIFNDFKENKFDNLILFLREVIYKHINKEGDNYGDDIEELLKMLDKIQIGSEKESKCKNCKFDNKCDLKKINKGIECLSFTPKEQSEKEPKCYHLWKSMTVEWFTPDGYKYNECTRCGLQWSCDDPYPTNERIEYSEKEELEVIKPDIKLEMIMKEFCEVCHHQDNHFYNPNQSCKTCVRKNFSFPYTCNDGWAQEKDLGSICINWTNDKNCKAD